MKKYIISSLTITIIVFISILLFIPSKKNKTVSDLVKNNMLAFTIDGKSVKEMPKKGEGYFVDSIKCDKGSVVIWDNYNWEIEITEVKNEDSCIIDFTKNSITANMVTIVKGDSVTTPNQYKDTITYNYNGTNGTDGSVQTFTAPVTGNYDLQVWGASGGNSSSGYLGGNGGYSKGTISLNKDDVLYIYVGGKGSNGDSENTSQVGGYNGGGKSSGTSSYSNGTGGSGGGATHIAKVDGLLSTLSTSISNILLVAGAGGGAANYSGYVGGAGGGTTGTTGIGYSQKRQATAGSQTAGGAPGYNSTTEMTGSFGKGGDAYSGSFNRYTFSGGGGAGFYGGGGGSGISGPTSTNYRYTSGGGGGSGYINTSLTNALTLDGTKSTIPTVDGTGTETGHTGNGAAVISYDITVNETITPNEIDKVLDSSSKTVTSNGTIVFYPKGNSILISVTGCDGIIENNKLIVANVTKNTECKLVATKDITTLYNKILTDNPTIKERTDFSVTFSTNSNNTLYTSQEENTTVYYYAGNTTNNWVKFGGYYWRIIRTNHDKSIRLLFAGITSDSTKGYIGSTLYSNPSTGDPMYAGYMYGTSGSLDSNRTNENDSYIKDYIDKWYDGTGASTLYDYFDKNNSLIKYETYLSKDAIYCNDRTINSFNGNAYSLTGDFEFNSYTKLYNNNKPSYDCANVSDKFSVNNASAKLTYPIALMTADEIVYAGGTTSTAIAEPYSWFIKNSNDTEVVDKTWWTMSPARFNNNKIQVYQWHYSNKRLVYNVVLSLGVRPVISLKGNNKWKSGDGSASNPYEIVTE